MVNALVDIPLFSPKAESDDTAGTITISYASTACG